MLRVILRAVLCVHHQDYDTAHQLIEVTRDMLDTELTALSAESYQRAYPIMVQVQEWTTSFGDSDPQGIFWASRIRIH